MTGCAIITKQALAALYNALGGASWTNDRNAGWLGSAEPCASPAWAGLSCSSGAVIQLDLNGANVRGTLPTEIGALSGLRVLDLFDNSGLSGVFIIHAITLLAALAARLIWELRHSRARDKTTQFKAT